MYTYIIILFKYKYIQMFTLSIYYNGITLWCRILYSVLLLYVVKINFFKHVIYFY